MNLYQCNSTVFGTTAIKQAVVSQDGIIIVLTENNSIFYGRVKLKQLLKLEYGILPSDQIMLFFDILNRLYITKTDGTSVEKTLYPLANEVRSALYPETGCPFSYFVHNVEKDMYFMDMNERITLWAVVVYPITGTNQIDLYITGNEKIRYKHSMKKEHEARMMSENKTLTFYQDFDFLGKENYEDLKLNKSGLVVVELKPNKIHLSCPALTNTVNYISVGCPPGRQIRVKNKYVAGYDSSSTLTQSAFYDWDNLGCPILRENNLQNFQPELEMYDNDVLIKNVDANFVIWEENRRTDFSYTGTMEGAGCRQPAQTWNSMMTALPGENDPLRIWGPHNYVDCFADTTERYTDLSGQIYEIFNGTGPTKIIFSNDHNGIYIFEAWIIDPNYSFCLLSTRFAVESSGAVPERDMMPLLISVSAIMSAIILVVCWTYTIYRKQYNKELGLNE
ncbi:cation channel sperm-associated auxiliary subunit epsilon-like [Tubulanus polymorphus]|uniref:cation channel sperm-associated auxiliary subunit epsilon-like n=1 Tax=Tubulanus polymorphus TaxID=672921 RepID=UPI003DA25D0A